jgi:hypothetical protein
MTLPTTSAPAAKGLHQASQGIVCHGRFLRFRFFPLGSMPLGNNWSFPSRVLGYDDTLAAIRALAERISRIYGDSTETGHPIDITWPLEPAFFQAASDVRCHRQGPAGRERHRLGFAFLLQDAA